MNVTQMFRRLQNQYPPHFTLTHLKTFDAAIFAQHSCKEGIMDYAMYYQVGNRCYVISVSVEQLKEATPLLHTGKITVQTDPYKKEWRPRVTTCYVKEMNTSVLRETIHQMEQFIWCIKSLTTYKLPLLIHEKSWRIRNGNKQKGFGEFTDLHELKRQIKRIL